MSTRSHIDIHERDTEKKTKCCLFPAFIKSKTNSITERITNKPSARMVRNSMSTMFNYNNVKTVQISNRAVYSSNHSSNSADRLQFDWCIYIYIWIVCGVRICWGSFFGSFMCLYAYKYILRMPISFLQNYCNHIRLVYVRLNNNNKWNHMNAFAPPTETLWLVLISPILVTSKRKKNNKNSNLMKTKIVFAIHLYFAHTLFTCRHSQKRYQHEKNKKLYTDTMLRFKWIYIESTMARLRVCRELVSLLFQHFRK